LNDKIKEDRMDRAYRIDGEEKNKLLVVSPGGEKSARETET
jgi:hypothetical protein